MTKMIYMTVVLIATLCLLPPFLYSDEFDVNTTVELQNLRVSLGYWSDDLGWVDNPETSMSLRITRVFRDIIDIDLEKSSLDVFEDDRGTNLLESNNGDVESKPNIEDSGSSGNNNLFVKLKGGSLPNPDAETIKAEGTLVINVGKGRTEVETRNVVLEEGSEISAGLSMFKITKAGQPDMEKHPWARQQNAIALTIEGKNFKTITRELRFTDERGNNIGMSMLTTRVVGDNIEYDLIITRAVEKVNAKLVYYAEVVPVKVPFRFITGIDMEEPAK